MSLSRSRLRRLALITLALDTAGRIEGRTKFQKMAYLANLIGWAALDFEYHNYGPYSDTLAIELDNMKNNGWIREYDIPTGKNHVLYSYAFDRNTRGIRSTFVGKLLDFEPESKRMVDRTRGLIRELAKFSSDNLEIMATLVFESQEEPSLANDELVRRVHDLKPRFSIEEIKSGLRIFKIMNDILPRRSAGHFAR